MIVNDSPAATPPPGAGFDTVIVAAPAAEISAAAMAAVKCVALTNVVARLLPFHKTNDPATKPLPFTVSVNAAEPAVADDGKIPLAAGAGLSIVNVAEVEVPPPGAGLSAVTAAVPAAARSAAGISAVICVALTNVVERLAPFHKTCDPVINPLPVTVRVNPLAPTPADAGTMEASDGAGFAVTVNEAPADVPPPGA